MLGSTEFKLHGIGQLFVLEKLLEKTKVLEFYNLANKEKISLGQYLVKNNILTATQIASAASKNFGVPILDLDCINIESIPLNLVNEKLIRQHSMVPLFHRGNYLYLATEDPSKQNSLKEIQFQTGLNTYPIVVEVDKLYKFINHLLTANEDQCLSSFVSSTPQNEENTDHHDINTPEVSANDAPIVKFVNKILVDAIEQGASDIHFEPYDKEYRIRYRQDGILKEIASPPVNLGAQITARIKILSNLDISQKRTPQDGGFKMRISKEKTIDFRVSTCPTTAGEKIVIRILDSSSVKVSIDALGFNLLQKNFFLHSLRRPQGLILVTGPTGSGKTVTLYSALNMLNTKEVNISTAEDPVEIKMQGINQVNINLKAGLTFAKVLRSFLRQDPDIIMIGEIRDLETAEIAIKASQTGHLVLSTLHTNSAAETLNRLMNMGIPTFDIASSISLIIAQRLARKLCEYCKVLRDDITRQGLLKLGFLECELPAIKLYRAVGCNKCTSGYHGRIGLFEVLPITKSLGQMIMSDGNSIDILKAAKSEGMLTIFQSGLEKIKQGITTIEELNRVTVD